MESSNRQGILRKWQSPKNYLNITSHIVLTDISKELSLPDTGNNFRTLLTKLSGRSGSNITNTIEQHNNDVLLTDRKRRKKVRKMRRRVVHFDAYRESLQHSNRVFNLKYGFVPRYVPLHMPFLIDVDIARAVQEKFRKEFTVTSSNRIRNYDDMQYAFTYFYYIVHEKVHVDIGDIFNVYDTDESG